MFAGAALLANAISASRGIMYSLRGGYFVWARAVGTAKVKSAVISISFFISDNLLFYYRAPIVLSILASKQLSVRARELAERRRPNAECSVRREISSRLRTPAPLFGLFIECIDDVSGQAGGEHGLPSLGRSHVDIANGLANCGRDPLGDLRH